ncbi:MAG: alpha/beta hydrolase [Polyangiales bacterium]
MDRFLIERTLRDLRVGLHSSRVIAATALRRATQGPKHPTWSYQFEVVHEVIRAVVALGFSGMSLELRRAMPIRALSARVRQVLDFQAGTIAGLPMEQHTPRAWQQGDLVWLHLHGGAYSMCSPATHRSLAVRLALRTGARVILPEYRKAPEHPFPAAIDDVLASYRALLSYGVAPAQIVVGGDSAGGGLALALAQRLRALALPQPRALVLLSPWVDLTATGGTIEAHGPFDYLSGEMLAWGAANYLAGADPRDPLVSPVFADLSGLPPMLVQSGGSEILLGQNVALVERARAAGVQVHHEISEGMVHVFHVYTGFPASRAAFESLARFVRSPSPNRASTST